MNDDLISREDLKKAIEKYRPKSAVKSLFIDGEHCMFMNCITEIDNAPTVEPFEPDYVGSERLQARQRGYEEGYHYGMAIGKTLNPKIKQGEWIPVSERLPEKEGWYLVFLENERMAVAHSDGIIANHDFEPKMLAWQPLPEPYQKGSKA